MTGRGLLQPVLRHHLSRPARRREVCLSNGRHDDSGAKATAAATNTVNRGNVMVGVTPRSGRYGRPRCRHPW
jgi:hypothetical protein